MAEFPDCNETDQSFIAAEKPCESFQPSGGARIRRHPTELAMDTLSHRSVFNSIVAGYVAGVCGTVIGHPFDSAKVWMQTTDPMKTSERAFSGEALRKTSHAVSSASISRAALQESLINILAQTQALYRGITGPLLTVGLVQSINFGVYDASRRMLYGLEHPQADQSLEYLHHDSLKNIAIASATAGTVLACFTLPMLTIKTQQQTRQIGFHQAISELSWRIVLRATVPHLVTETAGRAVYFVTYEGLKRAMLAYQLKSQSLQWNDWISIDFQHAVVGNSVVVSTTTDNRITLQQRMLCAAVSGITCWSIIFPLDALRSRILAARDCSQRPPSTLWDTTVKLYQQSGMRGFYRGFSVTVLRAGPVAATVLPIYDMALEALSTWNP